MKSCIPKILSGLILTLVFLPALVHAKPHRGPGMLNPKRIEKMAGVLGIRSCGKRNENARICGETEKHPIESQS